MSNVLRSRRIDEVCGDCNYYQTCMETGLNNIKLGGCVNENSDHYCHVMYDNHPSCLSHSNSENGTKENQ